MERLSAELHAVFDGSDGATFGGELLADPTLLCLEASEDGLLAIAAHFEPSTGVDRKNLRELSNSEGIAIGDGEDIHGALPRAQSPSSPPPNSASADTAIAIARRFLVSPALARIRRGGRRNGHRIHQGAFCAFGVSRLPEDLDALVQTRWPARKPEGEECDMRSETALMV
jgi:hypothetical protein